MSKKRKTPLWISSTQDNDERWCLLLKKDITLKWIDVIAAMGFVYTTSNYFFCLFCMYWIDVSKNRKLIVYDHQPLDLVVFIALSIFLFLLTWLNFLLGWAGRRHVAWPATLWRWTVPIIYLTSAVLIISLCYCQLRSDDNQNLDTFKNRKGDSDGALNLRTSYCACQETDGQNTTQEARTAKATKSETFPDLSAKPAEKLGQAAIEEFKIVFYHEIVITSLWLLILLISWMQVRRFFSEDSLLRRKKHSVDSAVNRFYHDRLLKRDVNRNYSSSDGNCTPAASDEAHDMNVSPSRNHRQYTYSDKVYFRERTKLP